MITAADAVASKTTEPRASSNWGTWAVPADSVRIFGFLAAAFQSAAAALHRAATKGNCASGAGGAPPPSTRMASTLSNLASSKLDRIVAPAVCSTNAAAIISAPILCSGSRHTAEITTLHNRWPTLRRGAAPKSAAAGAEDLACVKTLASRPKA